MKDYAPAPFQFKIVGKAYTMQAAGFADIKSIVGIGESLSKDPEAAVQVIEDLVRGKSDKRTAEAVMSLPPRSVIELLRDWTGISRGESKASGDE